MREIRCYEELIEEAVEGRLQREAAYALALFALVDPNPAMRKAAEVRALREVSVSQGIMLEQASERLLGRNMAHWASPDKVPARRMETLDAAGRSRVPFTTGVLIGIGETVEERVDTLLAIRAQHES